MAGAPPGNTNSKAENRLFGSAVKREATQNPELVLAAVKAMFAEAAEGNVQAFNALADRTEGKAAQAIELGGGDKPLVHKIERDN